MPEHRFASIDTKVLLQIEAGNDDCLTAVDWLCTLQFQPIVTETVLQELADICLSEKDSTSRGLAERTRSNLHVWMFLDPQLSAVDNGLALHLAQHVLDEGLMPDASLGDALVVSEAAFHDCALLVTDRQIILSSNSEALGLILIQRSCIASPLLIVSPQEIVRIKKSRSAS